MRIDVITLFPAMIEGQVSYGIQGRAIEKGLLQVVTWNPRDFSHNKASIKVVKKKT
jgi:tRNA (guanine37-N1)-methyltransferase